MCICDTPMTSAIWLCVRLPKKRMIRIWRSRSGSASKSGASVSRSSTPRGSVDRAGSLGQRGVPGLGELVERVVAVGVLRGQALDDVLDGHAEPGCDLRRTRGATQLLGERPDRGGHRALDVLEPARHAHRPRVVAEVPSDLTGDRRDREGQEVEAAVGVEAVDRTDQAHRARLHEVVFGLTAAREAPRDVLGHREVARDQLGPQRRPPGIAGRQVDELLEQGCQMGVLVDAFPAPRRCGPAPSTAVLGIGVGHRVGYPVSSGGQTLRTVRAGAIRRARARGAPCCPEEPGGAAARGGRCCGRGPRTGRARPRWPAA